MVWEKIEWKKLEGICPELKQKPFKYFKGELPEFFGYVLSETDKWKDLPLNPNERFIDFIQGLKETSNIKPDNFQHNIHLKEDYTGFVKTDPSKVRFKQASWFAPQYGFIENGMFRYAQSEMKNKDICTGKEALFVKNSIFLEIIANGFDEDTRNECTIGNIVRVMNKNKIDANYSLTVIQFPRSVSININKKGDSRYGTLEQRTNPLIELNFLNDYKSMLHELNTDTSMFNNLQGFVDRFGSKYIASTSEIFKIAEQNAVLRLPDKTNVFKLNEALALAEVLNNYK